MTNSDIYSRTKLPGLNKMHLRPSDVYPALSTFLEMPEVHGEKLGESFNQQPIYKFRFGQGPLCIFAWSQMHGNEPTATAALIDLMNFLTSSEGIIWQREWQHKITLHLVPMLNPDGAESNTRVNAQGIDINRDASDPQSPEGKILKSLLHSLNPDVAFNLHDQSRYYLAGQDAEPTVLAFMAPPPDQNKTVTAPRRTAMQLIGALTQKLNHFIAGKIARYDDSFSQRAFGDYAASLGAACILIESGTEKGDPNRQIARKMNFLALFEAIESLTTPFLDLSLQDIHDNLPLNVEDGITDVLIKRIGLKSEENGIYHVDVNIQLDLQQGTGTIRELGDLRPIKGYVEFDAGKYTLVPTSFYRLEQPLVLTKDKYFSLIRSGFLSFEGQAALLDNQSGFPVDFSHLLTHNYRRLSLDQSATFAMGIDDVIHFAVIGGIILDVKNQSAINAYTY